MAGNEDTSGDEFLTQDEDEDSREMEENAAESTMKEITGNAKTPAVDKPFRKRKASPLYKSTAKTSKTSRKTGDTKGTKKTSDTKKSVPTVPKSSAMSFADMLLLTFAEPPFIVRYVPLLQGLMTPVFEGLVKKPLDDANENMNKTLEKITSANKMLHDKIEQQIEMISGQRVEIDKLASELEKKDERIDALEDQVKSLTAQVNTVKLSNNDLNQYGRRNSIRLSNIKIDPDLPESDITKEVTAFLNSKILPGDKQVRETDIERCHPIGRANEAGYKQILVKFTRYHTKRMVFSKKSKLKGNVGKIFMSEDLTQLNYGIVKSLLALKKDGDIYGFWTSNGNVLAKKTEHSSPVRLNILDDIETKLEL